MPEPELHLDPYQRGDAAAIRDIYAHYVRNTSITFELDVPSLEQMAQRLETITGRGHPLIVARWNERIVGYAYASTYRPRPAYRFTCENAIYLDHTMTGKGFGSQLFDRLIRDAQDKGFNQMVAIITSGTTGSIALHKKFGFRILGQFPELGYKFDRWHDITHMQRKL